MRMVFKVTAGSRRLCIFMSTTRRLPLSCSGWKRSYVSPSATVGFVIRNLAIIASRSASGTKYHLLQRVLAGITPGNVKLGKAARG